MAIKISNATRSTMVLTTVAIMQPLKVVYHVTFGDRIFKITMVTLMESVLTTYVATRMAIPHPGAFLQTQM